MNYFVHIGPAAIAVGRFWIGVASGNRHCSRLRRSSEQALRDAQKLEDLMLRRYLAAAAGAG